MIKTRGTIRTLVGCIWFWVRNTHLAPEVTRHVLRRLCEGEKGSRSIVTHRLLQFVNLFRDVAESSLQAGKFTRNYECVSEVLVNT